jgi:hypothetical protein
MRGGLHVLGDGAQRLGIGVVLLAVIVVLAYSTLVFALVAIQAFTSLGSS